MTRTSSYDKFIEAASKHCNCCPMCQDHPCAGAMAGGVCDEMGCVCDDYDAEESDDDY